MSLALVPGPFVRKSALTPDCKFIRPSHQTRSHSVPKNFVKRTSTSFGRSGRTNNLLQSVNERNGRVRTGKDGIGSPEL